MDEKRCGVCGRERWRRNMPSEAAIEASCTSAFEDDDDCYRLGYEREHSRVEVLEKALRDLLDAETRCGCSTDGHTHYCHELRDIARAALAGGAKP